MNKTLPTLEKDGFYFDNGVELNKEAPKTFWIPSDEAKALIKPGDIVKVPFMIRTAGADGKDELNGERMWVIVTERDEDWFSGILDNQPTCTDEMKPGLVVHFKAEHVINIADSGVDIHDAKFKEYKRVIEKTFPNNSSETP